MADAGPTAGVEIVLPRNFLDAWTLLWALAPHTAKPGLALWVSEDGVTLAGVEAGGAVVCALSPDDRLPAGNWVFPVWPGEVGAAAIAFTEGWLDLRIAFEPAPRLVVRCPGLPDFAVSGAARDNPLDEIATTRLAALTTDEGVDLGAFGRSIQALGLESERVEVECGRDGTSVRVTVDGVVGRLVLPGVPAPGLRSKYLPWLWSPRWCAERGAALDLDPATGALVHRLGPDLAVIALPEHLMRAALPLFAQPSVGRPLVRGDAALLRPTVGLRRSEVGPTPFEQLLWPSCHFAGTGQDPTRVEIEFGAERSVVIEGLGPVRSQGERPGCSITVWPVDAYGPEIPASAIGRDAMWDVDVSDAGRVAGVWRTRRWEISASRAIGLADGIGAVLDAVWGERPTSAESIRWTVHDSTTTRGQPVRRCILDRTVRNLRRSTAVAALTSDVPCPESIEAADGSAFAYDVRTLAAPEPASAGPPAAEPRTPTWAPPTAATPEQPTLGDTDADAAWREVLFELRPGDDRIVRTSITRESGGQRRFREDLESHYGSACMVTGCDLRDAVDAAHIQDFRVQGDHHWTNGLLLRTDLHRLFDADHLAIDPDALTVHLSPTARAAGYADLEGRPLRLRDGHRPDRDALRVRWARFAPAAPKG